MTAKIDDIQKKTIKDVKKQLKNYNKCLLIRPPGFGKTKMSLDMVNKYKNVVFLYPAKSVEESINKYNINNIKLHLFIYNKLRNLYKSPSKFIDTFSKFNNKNTIFILDEVHCIGAPKTSIAVTHLMKEVCPNANYLGITATPNRTDKVEIKWHYFDGHTAYEYNIGDAIKDGIFIKPHYIYTPLDTNDIIETFTNKIERLQVSRHKKDQLLSRLSDTINPQRLNIENLDEVIGNNIDKFKNDMGYYKFILFFTKCNDIYVKQDEVVSAFKKIFPNCNINVIIVTSKSKRLHDNIKTIQNLESKQNTIDLIFSVNMLSLSYHVSNLTGIIMYRSTISSIVYTQQVGRCLSVDRTKPAIIFDLVENYKRDITDSVSVSQTELSNIHKLNQIDLLFPEDNIVLDDKTKELLEIDRLIKCAITEEFEEEVVNAYKADIVDIEYCIMKLHLHEKEDFMKVLKRYA